MLAIILFAESLRAAPFTAPVSACIQPQYGAGLVAASDNEQIVANADHVSGVLGQETTTTLTGGVTVSQRGRVIATNRATYDDMTKLVDIPGPSLFRGSNLGIESQSGSFNLNTESGIFHGSKFVLPQQRSHGTAQVLSVARSGTAQLDHASYTSCPAGHEFWLLTASRIHLDQDSGVGTARNATLRLDGVPVLWLPWFRFPIDGRRRTGFLYPTIGESNTNGFELRVPFYINLAPNYDDVFTLRPMTRRGVMLENRFRYLLPHTTGTLAYHYLGDDDVTGTKRDYVNFQNRSLLTDDLGLHVDFQQVSDINYFSDFGGSYISNTLSDSSTPFLPRGATLTFHRGNSPTVIKLLAESYQPLVPITGPDDEPYKRMPEVLFSTFTRNGFHDIHAGLDGNFNQFERSDSVTGQRIYADPYLNFDVDRTAWFMQGRVDGTWTQYNLANTLPGEARTPSRALPILSGGGGLRFDRQTSSGMLQTLEPQLRYLYVPYQNQDDLPVFDSGQPDFDFPELTARNRFTGQDRISDANQLIGMMTTRLTDPVTGLVKVNASVGAIYRFQAPRVTLPGVPLPGSGLSDLIGTADYHFNRSFEADGALQWNTDHSQVERANARLQYLATSRQRASIGYQYFKGLYNQADLSAVTPVAQNWQVGGRLIYSFENYLPNQPSSANTLSAFGGVEYDTCCWAVQAGIRRYIANVNGDFSTGVFIQFTLKGLTSLGSGWTGLLAPMPGDLRSYAPR